MKNKKAQTTEGIFSNMILLIIFLVAITTVGIFAGVIYYDMGLIDDVLHTVDFPIPLENNYTGTISNLTSFQDILSITIYPLLGLKSSLPMLAYFLVFAFIIAMGLSAYLSSKNPIFFILHLLFLFLITYFSLILSNTYIQLMENPFMNQMMVNFTIYNKLMFYLPQIIFFTGLLFGVIAFISLMKPQSSTNPGGVSYGGDY